MRVSLGGQREFLTCGSAWQNYRSNRIAAPLLSEVWFGAGAAMVPACGSAVACGGAAGARPRGVLCIFDLCDAPRAFAKNESPH